MQSVLQLRGKWRGGDQRIIFPCSRALGSGLETNNQALAAANGVTRCELEGSFDALSTLLKLEHS